MAGIDYLRCMKCGNKAVYDADWFYRVDPEDGWEGDIQALCRSCARRHKLGVVGKSESEILDPDNTILTLKRENAHFKIRVSMLEKALVRRDDLLMQARMERDIAEDRVLRKMSETKEAFQKLFVARGEAAGDLFVDIVENHNPSQVLGAALEAFREKGNQDRLALCTSLLYEMGRASIDALENIATAMVDEQSAFVDLIASADFLSTDERGNLLYKLACSRVVDTRRRLPKMPKNCWARSSIGRAASS